MDGGRTYNAYLKSWQKKVELEERILKAKIDIRIMEQLLTVFVVASSVSPNPTVVTRLGQLQSDISEKNKELHDMVIF